MPIHTAKKRKRLGGFVRKRTTRRQRFLFFRRNPIGRMLRPLAKTLGI